MPLLRLAPLLLGLVLLAGCAGRLPPAAPLAPAEEPQARALLDRFLARTCPQALDADVTLAWQGYGNQRAVAATLQARQPGRLRLAVNDPLGRPLLLLVTDGRRFTLVDVTRKEANAGPLDSAFWRQYVPAAVHGRDLFAWLTGLLPAGRMEIRSVLRSTENSDYWFVLDYGDGILHRVRLDPERLLVREHLLLDAGDRMILEAVYTYGGPEDPCPLPATIRITGHDLKGAFSLAVDRVYTRKSVAETAFRVNLPPHFTIHRQ